MASSWAPALIITLAFDLITPPYGLSLLMASKFVGMRFSAALRAACSALAAKDGVAGVDRLFQGAGRREIYLPLTACLGERGVGARRRAGGRLRAASDRCKKIFRRRLTFAPAVVNWLLFVLPVARDSV